MTELNERAKEYMLKYGWKHIVLSVEEYTSWCAPPYKEVAVSFTDEEESVMQKKGYAVSQSELGNVYYPEEGVEVPENIVVKYVEYPWITCFEVEGLKIMKEKSIWKQRNGYIDDRAVKKDSSFLR